MIDLKNKNVVVFGLGVSGISALRLVHFLGAKTFAINSGPREKWMKGILDFCVEENCFSEDDSRLESVLENADLLILSPGIPRDHLILNPIHRHQIPIWGEIELGYQVIKAAQINIPIIGITGTNGKTTTTTFLGEMIKGQGKNPFVGGNIGIPFCDMAYEVLNKTAKYDYILLELSSFQLESIVDFRPNVAIILNIFQNHGERYENIEDYAQAKFNMTKNMLAEDIVIVPSDFPMINEWAQKLENKIMSFDSRNPLIDFNLDQFKLPGLHNRVNLKFILMVADIFHFDRKRIQNMINEFHGVHHRIEYVSHPHAFVAYNDAKSTNWDATLTAVKAMEQIPGDLYLIIGGKKRGHGDSILPFIEILKSRVKRFYLMGEMGSLIESEIKSIADYRKMETLDQIVNDVIQEKFNGVVLFSPGFPSFDQYSNYVQRGEHFVQLLLGSAS